MEMDYHVLFQWSGVNVLTHPNLIEYSNETQVVKYNDIVEWASAIRTQWYNRT
jgi:hypothetical protein